MQAADIDRHQRHNLLQTILLLASMAAVVSLAGFILFGKTGVIAALVLLALGVLFSQPVSTALVLRAYKARRIQPAEAPELLSLFNEVCRRADLDPLPLYYVPSRLPNAFAAGTGKQAVVAITDGLLRMLSARELAGVLAHEVAHVVNRDVRVMGIADSISRTTSMMSRTGIFMMLFSLSGGAIGLGPLQFIFGGMVLFFAPMAMVLLQLAISRTREFDADMGAAEITGDPTGLAMALRKLEPKGQKSILQRIFAPGPKRTQPAMLRTHPPTDERVARLKSLADKQRKSSSTMEPENPRRRVKITSPRVRRYPRYHAITGMWH